MCTISLKNVRKAFGEAVIIPGADLEIKDGEFIVFVGPSGCGKSTLLRLIAGLEDLTSGQILIDGEDVTDVPPAKRGLAMVFQSYALYPHMSVRDNMAFALKLAGASKAERAAKVAEASRILQLDAYLDRKPKDLSGGQRQRVAIGRAIVRHPKIFLFDEPLSNLDAALRGQMRIELARLHRDLNATMIYVTHDQVEAMTMADKIVVLNAGRIEQVGSPLELYHHPANLFVAGFIGSPRMNLLPVRATGPDPAGVRVALPGGGEVVVPVDGARAAPGAAVTLGIRPEALKPGTDGALAGEVTHVERLGGLTLAHVTVAGGATVVAQIEGSAPVRTGETIRLTIDPGATHLFDGDGRALPHRSRHPLAA